jgi:acyl-CoA synthetase (NDP forming)
MRDLRAIFEPKSVAVIGATSNPLSVTNMTFLQQLLDFGYPGRIYPVNPRVEEVLGLKAYASIKDIPEPVDYVVCAISAAAAPDLMRECVAAKVKVVSLFTAGFSEVGEDGATLEREVVEIARKGGVLVLGPNCLGVHCPKAGLTLEGSIARRSGHVGFISQSGGVAQDMILSLAEREMYISKLVSLGNAADLNESDYLEYLGQDDETRIIGAYVEGIKEPERFLSVAREVARKKPLVVLKGGRTPAGAGAVRLHTGSLAGSMAVWEAVCRQAGIVQVNDLRELTDAIQAFTYLTPPKGRRVGIVGVGGGFGVLAADECISAGLTVPEFAPEVKSELQKHTPLAGTGLRNPVDTTPNTYTSPDTLAATVRAVAGWDEIDVLLVSFPLLFGIRMGVHYLSNGLRAVIGAAREHGKPIVIILSTANFAEGEIGAWKLQKQCFERGVPAYFTFAQAARAVNHIVSRSERVASEHPR